MGCLNGSCGVRQQSPYQPQPTQNAGCAMCAEDRYRLKMRGAFNPWADWHNAGKILSEEGTLVTGPNPGEGGPAGGKSATGGGADYTGILSNVVDQIGQTARAQIAADAARSRSAADAAAAAALALANQTRSTQERLNTTPQASSGGGGGMILLAVLAAAAAVMTGAVKLPKGK